jgi:hypothetical protein
LDCGPCSRARKIFRLLALQGPQKKRWRRCRSYNPTWCLWIVCIGATPFFRWHSSPLDSVKYRCHKREISRCASSGSPGRCSEYRKPAQLQEKKQLRLPVQTDIEKAFDNNETEKLSAETTESKSPYIHLAFVLARNADMRDAEIRALTWGQILVPISELRFRVLSQGSGCFRP